jgi:hypothetical protein
MRVIAFVMLAACGGPAATSGDDDDAAPDAGVVSIDAPVTTEPLCTDVTDAGPLVIGTAGDADDYALTLPANSASATSWGEAGNEALVLEISGAKRGLIGHLVMHQGRTVFPYAMHLGKLAAGEAISVTVSTLSAQTAVRKACVGAATLASATSLGAAGEGLAHAPELRWPIQKRFDDLPVILGWSKAKKAYQTVYTNENGGTATQCGGGASGIQAEIARWGRGSDIEGNFSYGGAALHWERCTGAVDVTVTPIRMEGTHPILYYDDGHNRVFESRGGYGQTCGTGGPEEANGDLAGWNASNPGDDLAHDAGNVIIIRPLPVDMDALGYASFGGRREGLADHYAPWLYRITALELAREGKIDNSKSFAMARYLYADVRVADVGGSGDQYCATLGVSGGFKLRAVTTSGTQIDGPQITGDYASNGNHDYKRVAIPLPDGVTAADIDHFIFDAYDNDGIYLTAIGDAFVAEPDGPNGAKLDYVRHGEKALTSYVDDGSDGCTNGVNTDGPGGLAYACVGGQVNVAK